jgi:hypothetical protein
VKHLGLIAALALAGCAAAPVAGKSAADDKPARAHEGRDKTGALADASHQQTGIDGKPLPLGIISVPFTFDQRVPVQPAALELDTLPIYDVPKPLDSTKVPASMPPSLGIPSLRVDHISSGYSSYGGGYDTAVYVVLEAKLGRLQIGAISENQNASDRVYRTCGDKVYSAPLLTPARWETIEQPEGKPVEYHIVDGWFDAMSCLGSIVTRTVIKPKALLGGLMLGYRTRCEDCAIKETVVFITPALSQIGTAGLGGPAVASHGSFSIIKLPIRKGGAASFSGMAMSHSVTAWLAGTGGTLPQVPKNVPSSQKGKPLDPATMTDVQMGIEIQQAVVDEHPQAIAYATLLTR